MAEQKEQQAAEAESPEDEAPDTAGSGQEAGDRQEGEDRQEDGKGTRYVENIPEHLQPRFNRLYANMKQYERQVQNLAQWNERLEKTLDQLLERDVEGRKTQIQQDIESAAQVGDTDKVRELLGSLDEVKPVEKPKTEQQQPALPAEATKVINEWQWELAGDGVNWKRPWAQPGHPQFEKIFSAARSAFQQGYEVPQILSWLDKEMGVGTKVKKKAEAPDVMAGNEGSSSPPAKKGKTQLTPAEKDAAQKMGVSEERYAKQRELMQRADTGG